VASHPRWAAVIRAALTSPVVAAGRGPARRAAALSGPRMNGDKARRNRLVILKLRTAADNAGPPGKRLLFRRRYLTVIGSRIGRSGTLARYQRMRKVAGGLTGSFRMMIVEFSSMIITGGRRGGGGDHPSGVRDT
jgi:hypothetical protein